MPLQAKSSGGSIAPNPLQPRRQKGVGVAAPRSRLLYPLKRDPVPLYRRLGGIWGRCGRARARKILPPPDFDPRTVQPVGSRYTD